MNALRRTITAIVILSLLISGPGLAQNAAEREAREALLKEPDAAPKEAQRSANMRQKSESSAHYHNGVKVRPVAGSATPPSPPQPPVRPGLGTVLGSSRSRWPLRSGGAASVLVIPSAEIETKDLLAIHEDLNVMSRIFEKKLQEDAHITPAGARLFLDSSHYALITPLGRGVIQSMYLQDYAAVFLVQVDFPLSAPPKTLQEEKNDADSETDRVWERMKSEMYEPERIAKRNGKAQEYDPEKVERLKATLVESLKHATNIRNLKPDEWAILKINGRRESDNVRTVVLKSGGKSDNTRKILVHDKNTGEIKIVEGKSPGELGVSLPTVLVIRAKKADIDSFADGDIDLEQFRKRVQMLSYPYFEAGSLRPDMLEDCFESKSLY